MFIQTETAFTVVVLSQRSSGTCLPSCDIEFVANTLFVWCRNPSQLLWNFCGSSRTTPPFYQRFAVSLPLLPGNSTTKRKNTQLGSREPRKFASWLPFLKSLLSGLIKTDGASKRFFSMIPISCSGVMIRLSRWTSTTIRVLVVSLKKKEKRDD